MVGKGTLVSDSQYFTRRNMPFEGVRSRNPTIASVRYEVLEQAIVLVTKKSHYASTTSSSSLRGVTKENNVKPLPFLK